MLGRPKPEIELSAEEEAVLTRWRRGRRTDQGLSLRAAIVLLAAEGMDGCDIANELQINKATVCKWRRRFVRERLQGLSDAPRSGAPRTIFDEAVDRVIQKTLNSKPKAATHWSSRVMAKETGLSQSAIIRIWHTFGLQPHRQETFKLSKDPNFIEKVKDIVGLYLNPPERAIVLCIDEKSQIQALDRTQPLLPLRPGQPERGTHDYKRNGTTSLFAALNTRTGEVFGKCHLRHRSQEFLKFLKLLDASLVPKHGEELHLILDNYATHKTPAVKRWLLRHPEYQLHFTPTSSSWLNLVERFFAEITDKAIRRGVFKSVGDLIETIERYLKERNKNPKPFVWTAPAELILKRVANNITRTYNSGH